MSSHKFSDLLRSWYLDHHRTLPWRAAPGDQADPYRVWLSEIMLQQTTVVTVKDYFEKFLSLWPSVQALAAAPLDDVLAAWAGLGYYARARNLHKCANVVASQYAGQFPSTEAELRALPGIGPYTAAAIRAIAFQQPATVVDGNIERVISRQVAIETPLPHSKPEIKLETAKHSPDLYPGDFAQAMMDLGATICTPTSPKCLLCPVMQSCIAHKKGIQTDLPKKEPKKIKPTRHAYFYWIENDKEEVWIARRPETGLLGGMRGFPSTDWSSSSINGVGFDDLKHPFDISPQDFDLATKNKISHVFTHFKMIGRVVLLTYDPKMPLSDDGNWVAKTKMHELGLPKLMQKVVQTMI